LFTLGELSAVDGFAKTLNRPYQLMAFRFHIANGVGSKLAFPGYDLSKPHWDRCDIPILIF